MKPMRITKELVESLPPGAIAWDAEVRGFGVRRQRRDAVYVVKYRQQGRQRIVTIGRHGSGEWTADKARKEAIRIRGLIRDGRDIAAERDQSKAAPTLAEFASRYLDEYSAVHKKPRTREEDARLLRLHILPKLGALQVRVIAKADVLRFHSAMRDRPGAANRALALLSAIMGWAEKVGERPDGSNPCRHVDRNPEKPRERALTAPELARLGDALERAALPWTDASKAEWREECARQAEAAEVAEPDRAGWIAARMSRRDTAEDWRAIAAFRLLIFSLPAPG